MAFSEVQLQHCLPLFCDSQQSPGASDVPLPPLNSAARFFLLADREHVFRHFELKYPLSLCYTITIDRADGPVFKHGSIDR